MILNEPLPPIAAKTVFLDGLGQPDSAKPLFSHQTYVLSLPELASDAKVLRPRRVGWQFVTEDGAGVAVAGEVPDTPDRTDPDRKSTTSLTRGRAIDEALTASRAVRTLPEVRGLTFELRRLKIPALRIDAFWLKATPLDDRIGEKDRVYAFLTFQQQLKNKVLPAPAFLGVVRQLATERINLDNKPRRRDYKEPPKQPGTKPRPQKG